MTALSAQQTRSQSRWRRPGTLDAVGLVARLTLGGVMLVAGGLKVTKPEVSARAVQAYQLLPFDLATYLGYGLPIVEIVLGLLLLLGLFTRTAALVSGVMLVAFVIGISSAWARGLSIDCGCFGQGGTIAPSRDALPRGNTPGCGAPAVRGLASRIRPHASIQPRTHPVRRGKVERCPRRPGPSGQDRGGRAQQPGRGPTRSSSPPWWRCSPSPPS